VEKHSGSRKNLMASAFNYINEAENFVSSQGSPLLTWAYSRKAKDYTYLYGSSFDDEESSLTRHLETAFAERCDEYTPWSALLT
jgi:hypothetical protein